MAESNQPINRARLPLFASLLLGLVLVAACMGNLAAAEPGKSKGSELRRVNQQLPTQAELRRTTAEFLTATRAHASRGQVETSSPAAAPRRAPTRVFPQKRFVGLYGAPGMPKTIVGRKQTARKVVKRLKKQARAYKGRNRRPVVRGVDLVAVLATADAGSSGLYRSRMPDSVIRPFRREVRKIGGRLVLDIQPGKSSFIKEVKYLEPWLLKRRVDVALDPEWQLKGNQQPGKQIGSVSAAMINRVSLYLNRLARQHGAGRKMLVIHHFTENGVTDEDQIIKRPFVDITLDFDGFGSRPAKRNGYKALAEPDLFKGIALGYQLDEPLMTPRQVLRLRPAADYVIYQ